MNDMACNFFYVQVYLGFVFVASFGGDLRVENQYPSGMRGEFEAHQLVVGILE